MVAPKDKISSETKNTMAEPKIHSHILITYYLANSQALAYYYCHGICQTQSLKLQQYFKITYSDFIKFVFCCFRFSHFKDWSKEGKTGAFLMKMQIPTKQHCFKHITKYGNNTESEHAKIKAI